MFIIDIIIIKYVLIESIITNTDCCWHYVRTQRKGIITMATAFQINQRTVLFLCKCFGILNLSYILGSDGHLIQNRNIKFYSFLESMQMIVIFIFTYYIQKQYILAEKFGIYKCWIIIISARISEKWIIKYLLYYIIKYAMLKLLVWEIICC